MLEKLKDAEVRYSAIEGELASPDIFSDQERFTALMKEYKALTPIIEKYREYKAVSAEGEDLRSMLEDSLDPEMRFARPIIGTRHSIPSSHNTA